ncbi:hypothetical protein HDU76_006812 [Blyttiomyces sp. JEL0837]|nr:hypothetical protein HDU76_006812 [Blyttiomyces sp. JEL0837]
MTKTTHHEAMSNIGGNMVDFDGKKKSSGSHHNKKDNSSLIKVVHLVPRPHTSEHQAFFTFANEAFDIFDTPSGGVTGQYVRSSNDQLKSTFGMNNFEDILQVILEKGQIQPAGKIVNQEKEFVQKQIM